MEVTGEKLKSYIERIERLEAEKAERAEDIREVFGEAKAMGFDTKTMRKLIALRKKAEEKRKEEQALLETYASAIQMELF